MKKLLVTLAILVLCFTGTAFAGGHSHHHGKPGPAGPQGPQGPAGENGSNGSDGAVGATGAQGDSAFDNRFGAKLDAPYLVELHKNWYLGSEGGKDLNYSSASEGWFAYAKVTYTGTLFSFNKKD